MANVDYFLVFIFDLRDLALPQFGRYSIQCLKLKRRLDLIDRVAVRGVANTKSVDGKGAVTVLEGYVRVAVLVVIKRQIPVSAQLSACVVNTNTETEYIRLVETNTMSQYLNS